MKRKDTVKKKEIILEKKRVMTKIFKEEECKCNERYER